MTARQRSQQQLPLSTHAIKHMTARQSFSGLTLGVPYSRHRVLVFVSTCWYGIVGGFLYDELHCSALWLMVEKY